MKRGNKHKKISIAGSDTLWLKLSSCHMSNDMQANQNWIKTQVNYQIKNIHTAQQYLKNNHPYFYSWFDVQTQRTLFRKRYSIVLKMFLILIWGFIKAFFRDIICVFLYLKFQVQFRKVVFFQENIITKFDKLVNCFPQKIAIIFKDEQISFQELQNQSYRIANWLEKTMNIGLSNEYLSKITDPNYKPEQTQIGLMLGNIPEMPAFLIGIARVRAVSVLFNINQKRDILLNAFRASKCQIVIFDNRYLETLREIAHSIDKNIIFVMYDRDKFNSDKNNNINLNSTEVLIEIKNNAYSQEQNIDFQGVTASELIFPQQNFALILKNYEAKPPKKTYNYNLHDYIGYIFTSGTTGGNIKATPIDNVRYIVGFLSQSNAFGINQTDNVYISLPLFHSFPCVIGLGRCILGGSTITLAEKFSASNFWIDCVNHKCTVALYIGECCRYLLAQPIRQEETQHQIRMMCGLGMRKQIWKEFQDRFKIRKIAEFYGSSEGNINIFNMFNVEGSCGFIPYYFGPIQRFLFPIYLIHIDPITLEPIRSSNGLCKLSRPGETALIVGQIKDNLPYTKFLGYTAGKEESSKKIITDILSFGDYAFSSGDLMEMDIYGNLYFRDRTGDTFRYKGENVSTTEIEEIVGSILPKKTVFTCYGIQVPNCEGRVGMLAIEKPLKNIENINLELLYQHLSSQLPEYAIPKFIRFTDKIETTSTHKLIKYRLREAGFKNDSNFAEDQVYYLNKFTKNYVLLKPDDEKKNFFNF